MTANKMKSLGGCWLTSNIDFDKLEEDHDEYLQEVTGYPLKWHDDKEDIENKGKGETKHV